jgi:tetratricopeptide (TPR) repeat protein
MYDIKPLEEDWKKYQNKKKKPYYIALLGIIFVIIIFFFFNKGNRAFDNYINKLDYVSDDTSDKGSILPERNTLVNEGLTRLEALDVSIEKSVESIEKSNEILVDIPVLDLKEESYVKVDDRNRKKVHLNIIETSSVTAYEDVEKRFIQSNDIDDALFLARSYYKKGNYKKSESWAYEVNKLDPNLEEGLFIFIKSKVKLGRKNDALSILSNYLKKSNSGEAKNLLYKIENNKL